MNKSVTWLLPIKNGMPYLTETLASIESQTYPHWQILAWDNGSTDGTVEELHRWIPARLPGTVVTDRPLSLGNCLAAMVQHSTTEFCARIDADDINLPNRLEKQVEFLQQHPEIAVVGSQVNRIDEHGVDQGLWLQKPLHPNDIVHFLMRDCVLWHPSVMFRRSKVLEVGNYRDVFIDGVRSPTEDYDLWLRMACHYQLANLDVPLLQYRVHHTSITQSSATQYPKSKAADTCFCYNAPALYGCSVEDARLLREWRHPNPKQILIQIAEHLQKTQGGENINRLCSTSFIHVGRQMMSSKDVLACLSWSILSQDKLALLKEILAILTRRWHKLGLQTIESL